MTEQNELLEAALEYLMFGFSLIPSRNKVPALSSWKEYQSRRPTIEEIKKWFSDPKNQISLVCGRVSRGLIALNFHNKDKRFVEAVFHTSFDDLLRTTWVAETPYGYYIYFLYQEGTRNMQFKNIRTYIASEGGLVVSPPSITEEGRYVNLSKPIDIMSVEAVAMEKLLDSLKLLDNYFKTFNATDYSSIEQFI